jgi:hypothetical protein
MKRVLVGLDLNGRADVAARDLALDDPDSLLEVPLVIDGGLEGDIVLAGRDGVRPIAGPQARLAPHGRGGGWGSIGAPHLRRALSTAIDAPEREGAAADIRAAVEALARGASDVVLAVPDLPSFDEARQGRLIRAIRERRGAQVRLLWRSVAAFLDLLEEGLIPRDSTGDAWDILIHGPEGIEWQRLTLVPDANHPGHVAPRRDGVGTLLLPEVGLDALLQRARSAVMVANPGVVWDRCEKTRLGAALLSGAAEPGEVEILRTWNTTWIAVTAPVVAPDSLWPGTLSVAAPASGAKGAFLFSPLAPHFAAALVRQLNRTWPGVGFVNNAAIARGALRAGRLIERGLPHYFDRIEPIRIAIQRDDEPDWEYLIPADVVVPADREYVSQPLEGFVWPRDKAQVEFFILKGEREVRHWTAEKDRGPGMPTPVTLRVRQTPGQSWARLSVTSESWEALARAPVMLDWETIAPLDKTPEGVLEQLRHPPPGIPERIVERPHSGLWFGNDWAGIGEAAGFARREAAGEAVPISRWATALRNPRVSPTGERFWHVGTDGDLPGDLPDDVVAGVQIALSRIERTLLGSAPLNDNEPLIAATWCFSACPESVQDALVAAWEAHDRGRGHRLLRATAAIAVVKQGAGRAVTGQERLRRLLDLIVRSNLNHHDVNALAMILSRRAEAPQAMTRAIVDNLAPRLGQELLDLQTGSNFQQKFRATIQSIAGLFRWRTRESHALLASREPVAMQLRGTLEEVGFMLGHPRFAQVPALPNKQKVVRSIIEFLDGKGDPDILRKIEQA